MVDYTSREAAKKLGITPAALSKYIKAKKVPAPKTVQLGRLKVQSWTEAEVEHLRELLPKIKNGRKTRYLKKQSAEAKPKTKKKPQPRAAVPHEQRQGKKSKHPASIKSPSRAKYPSSTSSRAK